MPAYTGSSLPYAMTIQSTGTANAGAVSENVPVSPGTSYVFSVNAEYLSAFTTGLKLTLQWFTSAGSLLSTVTQTSGSMIGGQVYAVSTTTTTAPSTANYAVATVSMNGSPAVSNTLSIFSAAVTATASVPSNQNYAFVWNSWPWAPVSNAVLTWSADQALIGNADSLVLAGTIELMGGVGGVPCTAIPELLDANGTGPTYRILAPSGSSALGYSNSYDLNAPQPTQDVVASMLLDGERPFGYRASNRTMTIPIIIFGTPTGGMKQVLTAREYLMSLIDQQTWQITWTSADTGLPMVYDCFRALPSAPVYGFNYSAGNQATGSAGGRGNFPAAVITITVQALPYGRSDVDGIQNLSFTNPLIGGIVPPSSQLFDDFSTVTSGTGWVKDTTKTVQGGTASIRYDAPVPIVSPYPAATYTKVLSSPANMIGLTALSVWLGQAYDTQWPASPTFASNVTVAFTLTDGLERTLSFSSTNNSAPWGALPSTPKWSQVSAPVPQGNANFSYGDVIAYSVTVTNWTGSGVNGFVRMHAWLNDLVAVPQSVANLASPRGILYNLFSLPGSARSPINVTCQLPSTAPVTQEITQPVSGTWIVPPAVYQVEAEAWGGGGAGATVNQARATAGAGGGGGEYAAEAVLQVKPGTPLPYSLGSGGSPSQIQDTIIDLTEPGLHTWVCPSNVTSALVEVWGGGAAGAAGSGGGGAAGYGSAALTVTPGVAYLLSVGAGGLANSGTTSADNAARNGGPSWFGNPGTTGVTSALVGATGGVSPPTGQGTGGSGGDNSGCPGDTHWPGGHGGHAPGGGGGGGGGCGGRGGRGSHGHPPPSFGFGAAWCGPGSGGFSDGFNSGNGYQHGGGGGNGSSCPGTPFQGSYPGGGGGGGFCGAFFQFSSQAQQTTTTAPGQTQVNYMGANGANGLVQITYAIGNGNPVNGGTTTFGSASTTGTVVTAHGGGSAALNGATGIAGGTGSSNTVHHDGGKGGLDLTTSQASWMLSPAVTSLFQTLKSFTYTTASGTSAASASSLAQGTAVVLVESTAPVFDLVVTDSAGNLYVPQEEQGGGSGQLNGGLAVFTAVVSNPITTSTTLTVASATAQQYGVIWYGSAWVTDATYNNASTSFGTGTAVTGQFGSTDTVSSQYELVVVMNTSGQSFGTPTYGGRLWYAPGSTSSLAAGSLSMQAYVGLNEGGGTGGVSGDTFAQTLGGSSNWAVVCLPLMAVAQQSYAAKLDWRSGTTPGASTAWQSAASVQAEGIIAVVGMAGTGVGVTAGPTAVSDGGGNHYTVNSSVLTAGGGVMFVATAPVTAAVAQGASGTVSWGRASAAPNYWTSAYWIPNATGVDGVSAVTGSGTNLTATYTPNSTAPMVMSFFGTAVAGVSGVSAPSAPWNNIDLTVQSQLSGAVWAAQATDITPVTAAATIGSASSWSEIILGLAMQAQAQGGGAAGGPGNAGYNSTFYGGAPGYSGGGKGGLGAQSLNTNGGGASLPGGGGGGSYGNVTTSIPGGQGGGGAVRLTYQPPLTPFNTLVVHRPGTAAAQNLSPLVPIPFSDAPNNTEYTIVNPAQPNVNAEFNSTYTVILVNHSWNSVTQGSARTLTVTVHQYEYPGGPASSVQVSRSVTPSVDIVNGMVNMGEVTLPIKDYAKFNDQSYFTVSINDTDQTDRFQDVLFLDSTGQTVLLNIDPSQPGYNTYVNYYIDEPTADRDLGFIGGTSQDRQHNVSLMEYSFVSGGPLYIGPGDNLLLTYSPSGAPALGLTYGPRWYLDRII